jgi:hypothetical protein
MLEALTVPGGAATISLVLALAFIRQNLSLIVCLTIIDTLLPVKIAYSLDLELQRYFTIICNHEGPMETLSRSDASFAEYQLKTWLYGIALSRIPSVILPIEFRGIEHQARFGLDEEESEDEHQASPRKKKKGSTSGPNNRTSCEGNTNPSWQLPSGKEYGQVFKGDALRGWPLIKGPGGKK